MRTIARVTGELAPDATGDYVRGGTYGGHDYYRREAGGWYLWYWSVSQSWVISDEVGGGNDDEHAWWGAPFQADIESDQYDWQSLLASGVGAVELVHLPSWERAGMSVGIGLAK